MYYYSELLTMALHLFFYGIVSTLLTYSSLSHTLHGSGQVLLRHERDPEPNAIKYIVSDNVAVRPPISGRCRDLSG